MHMYIDIEEKMIAPLTKDKILTLNKSLLCQGAVDVPIRRMQICIGLRLSARVLAEIAERMGKLSNISFPSAQL